MNVGSVGRNVCISLNKNKGMVAITFVALALLSLSVTSYHNNFLGMAGKKAFLISGTTLGSVIVGGLILHKVLPCKQLTPSEKANDIYAHGYWHLERQEYRQAMYNCHKAAKLQHAGAMIALGFMYENGKRGEKNFDKAIYWYKKAAELKSADAMIALGLMYEKGTMGEKNFLSAMYWYEKAVELKSADAMFILGYIYDDGVGVEKNSQEAIQWWGRAASLGHVTAMYN